MNCKIILLFVTVFLCCGSISAAEAQKSALQQRAEAEDAKGSVAPARSLFIQAFNDYANKGQLTAAMKSVARATQLYYQENLYQEAFDLLRLADQTIAASEKSAGEKAGLHYYATKERLQMYMKMRKAASAQDELKIMTSQVNAANNDELRNDLLYTKTIYYYTFGMNQQGNAVFKEMANKLTAKKEYDKVDEVYQTLIANGRRSNSASLVAQSYSSYMAWKDSTNALKKADEINTLKKQIADNETVIAEQDSSLTTRQAVIIGLGVLAAALAAALVIGAIVLLRYIMLTRKQKKTIKLANENNALKAKFISNISAQLEPTLKKLDSRQPEVKALLDFSEHIQTLSELENNATGTVEMEDTQLQTFCEGLADQIRGEVGSDVTIKVNAPKLNAQLNREYVAHILLHLLNNAAEYTPAGGTIWLEYKKRGAHTHQFLVANTGSSIAEEKRDDLFKPFLEVRDLTKGDGLGLPICKQMALNMNGDLEIDPGFTKGVRFVLELHA